MSLAKELNKPVNKRILKPLYSHVKAPHPGYFQVDLMDMTPYKTRKGNSNFGYAMVIMDIYSRYGWVRLLKNKTTEDSGEAILSWIQECKQDKIPTHKVYTDLGNEFKGDFTKNLTSNNIKHSMTNSKDTHQVVVERWIRTLKEKIRDEWAENNNYNWVGHINQIVKTYNDTKHSRLKAKPIDLLNNKAEPTQYDDKEKKKSSIIEEGDAVRILRYKNLFDKPTLRFNYSKSVFQVESINGNNYTLNDGKTYPRWRLQKSKFAPGIVKEPEAKTTKQKQNRVLAKEGLKELKTVRVTKKIKKYIIEKIVDSKKDFYLVKWEGYPESANTWEPKKRLKTDVPQLVKEFEKDNRAIRIKR